MADETHEIESTHRHESSAALYATGADLVYCGELSAAVAFLEASARLHAHYKTLELLGTCHVRLGQYWEAITPLAAATALNKQANAPTSLAEAFLRLGDLDRARLFADEALRRNPTYRKLKVLVAEIEVAEAAAEKSEGAV